MQPLSTKWQQKWIGLDVHHPALQELGTEAEAFCHRWVNGHPGFTLLVIVGKFGSGKTHTAKKIMRFCDSASFTACERRKLNVIPSRFFIAWPEQAREFGEKNYSVMADAFSADLLVIDDVGAENDPWKCCADALCQIMSRREKKYTIITTNIQPAEWSAKFDGRIADRLLRNSVVVDLSEVPSYAMR